MNTLMLGGTLIALGDCSSMLTTEPLLDALAPVYRLVPTMRDTPERPGSIVNVRLAGARPLDAVTSRAAAPSGIVLGAAKVSVPPPTLVICTCACASPSWQSFCDRNTVVVDGIRIG